MPQAQQRHRAQFGEIDYSNRQHTRAHRGAGIQTAGVIDDVAGAIGGGVNAITDIPGDIAGAGVDVAYGIGEATVDATDAVVGGGADAVAGAWDWGVGGTADNLPYIGGGGGNQGNQSPSGGGQSGSVGGLGISRTVMVGGGLAVVGLGAVYYMNQKDDAN